MKQLFVITIFTLFLSTSVTVAQTVVQECGCSGLLGGGVFNKVNIKTTKESEDYELQFVSFSSYDEFKTAANKGVSGDYFGSYGKFGFKADSSKDEFERHQKEILNKYEVRKKDNFREILFKDYASDVIVNGYNECISTCVDASSLRGWFTINDEKNIVLTIYNGLSGPDLPTIDDFPSPEGVTIISRIPIKLGARKNEFKITRNKNVPINLVVKTSQGDITAYAPEFRVYMPSTTTTTTTAAAPLPTIKFYSFTELEENGFPNSAPVERNRRFIGKPPRTQEQKANEMCEELGHGRNAAVRWNMRDNGRAIHDLTCRIKKE